MIKELQYKGYATEPSDYECPDGQLATSLNLINEDEQLKPVFQPSELAELPSGYKVVYIHDTNTFTHYILLNTSTNKLYWIDESIITDAAVKPVSSATIETELAQTSPSRELYSFGSTEIYNVNGIGNTLIVLTANGMHYLLWKGDTEGYLYLGTHLPELPISFGLQGEMQRTDEFTLEFDNLSWETKTKDGGGSYESYNEFTDENKKKITSQVLAKVNKFIADRSTNKGKFIYPFLVRYAYRLYDGSLTMHSAPVLMVCSTSCAPIVMWRHLYGNKGLNRADVRVVGMLHSLDYAVINQSELDLLKNWSDIVKSVDIFVSKPIYTYDQNGECDKFFNYDEYGDEAWGYSICKHTNQAADTTKYPVRYQKKDMGYLYQMTFDKDNLDKRPGGILGLPRKDTSTVKEDIRNCSNFYFLESIKLDQLTTTRTLINIEEDYLQSLVNREVMTDDYDSHDKIMPRYAFGYNSRINLANLRKKLFEGFNAGAMLPHTDGYVIFWTDSLSTAFDSKIITSVFVYIKQDGKDIVVHGVAGVFGYNNPVLFLYYPNVNAYKAVITAWDYFGTFYEVPLERHSFLNGSFYYGGWNDLEKRVYNSPVVSSDAERTIEIPNKIYTSEVNNPFHFPVLGINTVGTGTILGISAAAKAMSQGQFGQFPLYAFTTEGVWALEVSSTGSYSARQPITRDVCINTDSITQIDSSVLFATDRGIMLISGSQTQCITDGIFSEAPFNVLDLPGIDQLHAKLGHSADACLPMQPFLGFLAGCQMVYDYVHQRIFVYNPTKVNGSPKYTYAYVFSLKSKMWGMVFTNLASTINAYPEALAMTLDNKLVSFSETDEEVCKGLYITRPLKLEAADVHKTISALIQRGHFQRGDVGTVLYGSRDLFSWHLVWSSKDHYLRGFRGTPYKYFRIAGLATLTDGKSIFGASVNFEPRHTNQLR
ncbi:MAG: hypothetical protein KAZ98_05550 [Prevotella sp.]|nr:hypothetical protein [Prevotella sp.]